METASSPKAFRRRGNAQNKYVPAVCRPITRVIARKWFDADPGNVVYLTLCEHAPHKEGRKPGFCLHLHNRTRVKTCDQARPAAMGVRQLGHFIEMLQAIREDMLAHASIPITKDLPSA